MKKLLLSILTTLLVFSAFAQDEPTVTTDTRYARGATMAFGRGTFKAVNGNTITKRGFCWSKDNTLPTVNDSCSNTVLSSNGPIYKMSGMEPATKYYCRAFAIGKNGSVGYGETIKIITLPMGTITWQYDNGGDSGQNQRISSAVESCVTYWNNLTNIAGLHLNVHYGSGTPTADCSYGGWMRVGPNESYQRTGTIMHEALHAIGVGTHGVWNDASTPLRAGSGTGLWLGDRANELLRFWDNNPTSQLTGDKTHMWPYGINGAQEDNGTEVLYTITSLLAQAVGEDGLPCTNQRSFGSPHYAFDQEDTIKYYIKNESAQFGLTTSFLVETNDGSLEWKQMSAADALADDAAAWYVTFTPATQYYQFRNAKTGAYITYSQTGANGIATVNRQTPVNTESFHLMRSRNDVKSASGTLITTERAYWIIHPDNSNARPDCLTATASGKTSATAFDLSDAASKQRWLILTSQQASDMENSGLVVARDEFMRTKSRVESLLSTPHKDLVEGATDRLQNSIQTFSDQSASSSSTAEVSACSDNLMQAAMSFLSEACVSDFDKPFDLTFFIVNPDFANGKNGWTGTITSTGTWNYGEVEFYQQSATAMQSLASMPKGTYSLSVQGFQRPGSYASVYDEYVGGTDNSRARVYLNSATTGYAVVKNIMADRSSRRIHTDDKQMADGTFIPNTMASAAAYFAEGLYDNTAQYYLADKGDLKIGFIASNNTGTSFWTCFTNFRLGYFGPLTLDEISDALSIDQTIDSCISDAALSIYNLSGHRMTGDVTTLPSGIYVINGKKTIVK
ncbi:MAG: hypothetical protein KBT20_01800 [Bacteroidales bacterium]|nr:hypothetical protein [Candidatus Liminaster caballi]